MIDTSPPIALSDTNTVDTSDYQSQFVTSSSTKEGSKTRSGSKTRYQNKTVIAENVNDWKIRLQH